MGTVTTKTSSNGAAAPAELSNFEQREALVAQYGELDAQRLKAVAKGDTKAAQSLNGRLSNLSNKISNCETELEIEGVQFEPFVKPKSGRARRNRPTLSQDQLVADLAQLGRVYRNTDKPSVKKNIKQRVKALMKQAERAEYKGIKNPLPKDEQ